jgi:GTP:adenosylcobinamide-phosphate guanylyltransferase
MHGLILAGGVGSRLSADGVAEPKALVPVGGRPQLLRLCDTLDALGCDAITCMVRAGVPAESLVRGRATLRVISCSTPSSLHTLALAFEALPPGPVFCTMVDTVMSWSDWLAVWTAWESAMSRGVEVLLAVAAPPQRDPQALHVRADAAGRVEVIGDDAFGSPLATAGVYGFAPPVRPLAARALEAGISRMRGFLAALSAGERSIQAVRVARALDVDRREDLEEANAWAPVVVP